jgi:hypothetical protein
VNSHWSQELELQAVEQQVAADEARPEWSLAAELGVGRTEMEALRIEHTSRPDIMVWTGGQSCETCQSSHAAHPGAEEIHCRGDPT